MARGPTAAGGSTLYADLVVDALARCGGEPGGGETWLDFGCSSGRLVRVLAAADVDWHGCDPLPGAIEWAREHFPEIRFEHSPEYPPLPYADGAFRNLVAISIWSHFSESASLRWLEEMRRIVMPGGRLLLTAHGHGTIAPFIGLRSADQLHEVRGGARRARILVGAGVRRGRRPRPGQPGLGHRFPRPRVAAGARDPDWGVVLLAPGGVEDDQDLYVLERRR